MRWSDLKFDPDSKTLRQFAALWLVFFGGLAAWKGLGQAQWTFAAGLAAAALAVGIPGLIAPRLIRPIFVGASVVAFPIGWLVSHLLLALLYFGLLTPVGLAFRLLGRDPLVRQKPAGDSFWAPKRAAERPEEYYQQY